MTVDTTSANGASQKETTPPLLGGECGKRLLFHIIDETARARPDAECFSIPRSDKPRDGWKPVSWAQVADAVNYAAHMITEQLGSPEPGTIPTIAYIGFDDPRYPIFMTGASKAGYKALFISPRNSLEAQLNLFEKTDCNILYYEAQYAPMVQPWVDGRPGMQSTAVAPFEQWMVKGTAPFPYTKTFAEVEWDTFVVLHTSGSTGLPKPVDLRHGMVASNDLHRQIPARGGSKLWLPTWMGFPNTRQLLTMPLFHGGGLMMMIVCTFYYDSPTSFREPTRPVTGEYLIKCVPHVDPGWMIVAPAVMDQMSRLKEGIDILKKLHAVIFGGGKSL
jgi:acyl-CoA synthetase (AMP-forming)/AMP-acid ligase II